MLVDGCFLDRMIVMLPPSLFLTLLVCITAGAAVGRRLWVRRHRRRLARAAKAAGAGYSAKDRFGLSSRVLGLLPVPGAARVRVRDVMYFRRDTLQWYVFTIDSVIGTLGRHELQSDLATAAEPTARDADNALLGFGVAPLGKDVVAAYASKISGEGKVES